MGITFALLLQGAFYRGEFVVFAGLVTGAAVLAASERRRSVVSPSIRLIHYSFMIPFWCVAGVVATAVSALANDRLSESFVTITVLLVGAMSAWTVGSVSPTSQEFLLRGVVVSAAAIAVTGMFGVVGHHRPLALVDGGLWRAASTLTYANATAAVLGMALPIAIAFAEHRPLAGLGARASAAVLTAGLLLTGSRAGFASTVVGLVVFGALAGWSVLKRALPSLAAGICLFVGLAFSMPAEELTRAPGRVIALVAGALAASAILSRSTPWPSAAPNTHRVPRRFWAIGAVLVIVTFAFGASMFLFRHAAVRERLSLRSSSRVEEWSAAIGVFRSSPIVGVGPGPMQFELRGTTLRTVAFAHNEYLQLLAQQGLVGLVALVGGFIFVVRRFRPFAIRGALLPSSALAGCVVLGLHAAFDYVLHIPAIVVGAAMLLALVATHEEERDATPISF